MTISPARLAANRQNAAKSTGPSTAEGKARSRSNALKHGLRALVVPIADEAVLQTRTVGVIEMIRPQNEFQLWVCAKIARDTVQIDRVGVIERQVRAEAAHRAEFCWDEDQQVEANRIARSLTRDPDGTVGLLRRSVAGCDWLIARWAMLADSAEQQAWTEEQIRLAHDLLGTPPEFRSNAPTHLVDDWGRAVVPAPTETELAGAYLDELREHRAGVVDDDEVARARAMADLDEFGNRNLRQVRRSERSLLNDLHNGFTMAQHESPHTITNPRLLRSIPAHFFDPSTPTPTSAPTPEPTPAAPTEPRVESIPTPDEPNEPKPVAAVVPVAPNEPKPARTEDHFAVTPEPASIGLPLDLDSPAGESLGLRPVGA